jgi:hypothetical protein
VTSKADDLFGVASSASSGTASSADLAARPYLRRGEILETIPGVIITQHAGGGKANQYFLRGFNLDHGTDFAISVDGMPVNMRTHAHGQGYADLNFLIPELIENVTYEKGVYSARNGDLSSAGSADFQLFNALPLGIATVTWGEHRRKNWEVAVECLNLLDREDNDIEYFYTSRLQDEPAEGIEDIHLHPNEPRTFRLRATYRF